MAKVEETPDAEDGNPPKKSSKIPLILGLVLAIVGGAGGFLAVNMGIIGGSGNDGQVEAVHEEVAEELPDLAFVPVETLVINLPPHARAQHLLFTSQLEVDPAYSEEVLSLMPRIIDVLNGYLRAVDLSELEDSTALIRLRAQMLRRVQVVVGDGRVKDILIMEFVLN
ncbi:flagellar basal body-associated FliL family protein [Octadecabacter sp. CECT 8868]|uniref:flagellar basal body-associated FliL family protein n=1 Tax=Octadecabacter algicola TaxID=2909342 RepID=UPI001F2CCB22|nr:flagellar basal body-associated FliL family protein [Octadecabacter algicola]MCF2905972.1 flagellar basal body-associated FliL family protein [Octadecabacter algicola]